MVRQVLPTTHLEAQSSHNLHNLIILNHPVGNFDPKEHSHNLTTSKSMTLKLNLQWVVLHTGTTDRTQNHQVGLPTPRYERSSSPRPMFPARTDQVEARVEC
jgi:hypothetical protein